MYFFKNQGAVCHVLEDDSAGKAPAPCGAKLTRVELMRLRSGLPTNNVLRERPADTPLCKHCQKALGEVNA